MWERKKIKNDARKAIKRNYVNAIIICLIIAIAAGGYTTVSLKVDSSLNSVFKFDQPSVISEIFYAIDQIEHSSGAAVNELINSTPFSAISQKLNLRNATTGVFASILNNSYGSNTFLVGILNTINKFVFSGRIMPGIIMIASTVLLFLFWVFVQNILRVGEARFFLENQTYSKTRVEKVLFVYRIKRVKNVAKVMLLRYLYLFLWSLTIVGGFIKVYSYRMVPYIIAENPDLSAKEVIKLSEEMMKGNKWKTFVLDLSFLHWQILSVLTYGILRYLYLNPYITATRAGLYLELRESAIAKDPKKKSVLNDSYLMPSPHEKLSTDNVYPVDKFTVPYTGKKTWIKLDYDRKYSIISYMSIFFISCFIGWIWEVAIYFYKTGGFVNRGTLIGPWLPIYGTGGLLMLILLKPFAKKVPVYFFSSMILCGILEYFTSWFLEAKFHTRWWDYSNAFFNLNGRICLEGLLFFALAGSFLIYVLAPIIDDFVKLVPKRIATSIVTALAVLFLTDVTHSFFNPNKGDGITEGPSQSQSVESDVSVSRNNLAEN